MVLAVQSEAVLGILERQFQRRGIPHVAVREPDEPYNGALTAIGLAPTADRAALKPLLARLPLFGKEKRIAAAV